MWRGLRRPFLLYVGVGVLIFVGHLLSETFGNKTLCLSMSIVKWTYLWGFLVAPILFLLWYGVGRIRGKRISWLLPVVALILLGNYIYATHIEPYRLKVREVTMISDKVSRPLRILHITDIQSDEIDEYEVSVFDQMIALEPDLILHTGDLIQRYGWFDPQGHLDYLAELEKLAAQFRRLDPPLGVYNVRGDTDPYLNFEWFDTLANITTLEDQTDRISLPDGHSLSLLGLSLPGSRSRGKQTLEDWLLPPHDLLDTTNSPPSLRIVFGHAPDYALALDQSQQERLFFDYPDLALAGHTHGGQVRLPFIGALMTMSDVPREWARGWRDLGATWLNVSAGIGAEHAHGIPPLRWNCPPEMTLILVKPKD